MNNITENEAKEALETLRKYKEGKNSLEKRIVDEEMFWKRRHWENINAGQNKENPPTSAWMFNSIINKHADAMDSFPEVKCLPREKSDEYSAQMLTKIIPVVLEKNGFEKVYSDNWWYKLKHGCAAYGVFWDNSLEGGLGDVSVKKTDLLNIFWEPGICDIEDSHNLFIVDLTDTEELIERFPKAGITGGGGTAELKQYQFDDNIDLSGKTAVIDWYYKKRLPNGRKTLHYAKIAEGKVLFASENEKGYENGWYEDGEYPLCFDVLYPEEGTPTGFGIISVTKDPQLYIDKLDSAIMKTAMMTASPRFFASHSSGINEEEFLDWSKPIIHVEGDLDERRIKQLQLNTLNGYISNFRQNKIDELKETSSNRDFSQGGTASGVTSGAAIATLQEAGNKTSRDMINASYRSYVKIALKIIERMRQFYTEERSFRITGNEKNTQYVNFSAAQIGPVSMGTVAGEELFRRPVFDIDIRAQKKNPYSTLSQNETAMNLYKIGFFNPQNAQMSLAALKIMDFEGKREVEEMINMGMTLQNQISSLKAQNAQMAAALGTAGKNNAPGGETGSIPRGAGGENIKIENGKSEAEKIAERTRKSAERNLTRN